MSTISLDSYKALRLDSGQSRELRNDKGRGDTGWGDTGWGDTGWGDTGWGDTQQGSLTSSLVILSIHSGLGVPLRVSMRSSWSMSVFTRRW